MLIYWVLITDFYLFILVVDIKVTITTLRRSLFFLSYTRINAIMSRFWLILPILVNSRSKYKNSIDHRSYKKVTTADLSLQIEKLRERIDELEKSQDFGDFVPGEITGKRSKRNSWQNVKES